jgi:hypothetical protein
LRVTSRGLGDVYKRQSLRGRFHREGPSDEGLTTKFQLRSRNYEEGIKPKVFAKLDY